MREVADPKGRLAGGERVESMFDIHDAQTLRLQVLKDELEPVAASLWRPGLFVDLELVAGDEPRLLIDLVNSVVMAPDPRTYRLTQDAEDGRRILFETRDRAEMVRRVGQHLARSSAAESSPPRVRGPPAERRYTSTALWLAWLSGLVMGVLGLFALGVLMARSF
jgi:hypothetical protein